MALKTATLRMPQRRPNSRLVSRNMRIPYSGTTKSRNPGMSRLQFFAAFLCLCLLVLGLWTSYRVKVVADELRALEVEALRLKADNEKLVARRNLLVSRANLEKLGNHLGLHPPRKEQLILLK